MIQKWELSKASAEQVHKNIRRQTRRQYSAEENIRIVLEGLRGEKNLSELDRREGIAAWLPLTSTLLQRGAPTTLRFALTEESVVRRSADLNPCENSGPAPSKSNVQ